MSVLVAGVNGFVGHHVARTLHDQNEQVLGVNLERELSPELIGIVGQYESCDLTDSQAVSRLDLSDVTAIINLAGFAAVGSSTGKSELYDKVNVGVHTTLYEACLAQNVSPRIIAVSTGAVYDSSQPMPQTEDSRLINASDTNPYVASKLHMEAAVRELREDRGIDCIIARPFNHTGPGQGPGFLLPDLAVQLSDALASGTTMKVGNLDAKRDFTDVRDVARAYVLLATCERASLRHSVYNICSGKSIAGQYLFNLLAKNWGTPGITTEVDPKKLREKEVMDLYGSYERLNDDTGWQPEIPIEQTIADFVAWKRRT